jgi:hypothetical protein
LIRIPDSISRMKRVWHHSRKRLGSLGLSKRSTSVCGKGGIALATPYLSICTIATGSAPFAVLGAGPCELDAIGVELFGSPRLDVVGD